ncbi:dienelactone hydrolase family protein [Sphingomonas sp. QA11]|uniref:dienelactone hydrolase family protein n=1 Tax=Sphingomonas sp. QA11 TaxID=2950605 RepID=UPI002349DB7B|nr:dienelactone hydrolase family protein [Sphingomonas sp. QA11]WCM28273.1 dienelactone hydrolase family protein [Sphingomonas sp. QA11]
MCDSEIHQGLVETSELSRRAFVMAGVAAAGLATSAFAENVVETDVTLKTPDGDADAALFHPEGKGPWPAVLIWPDILGLRPVFREMGRRLSNEGYVVLVPNPFYRSKRAPVVDGAFDFNKPEDRAKVMGFRQAMTDAGVDKDATAYLAFLDRQPQTDKKKKAGVQGYCMGGPLSFRTAAAVPGRIGAVGSFHGGGLVTAEQSSPHLLIAKTRAAYLVAVAQNDDARQPEAKDVLKKAFETAGRPATVEVYPADHGWCVPGSQTYNEVAAEKAWGELLKLYKANLT